MTFDAPNVGDSSRKYLYSRKDIKQGAKNGKTTERNHLPTFQHFQQGRSQAYLQTRKACRRNDYPTQHDAEKRKARRKRIEDGRPVRSFQGLPGKPQEDQLCLVLRQGFRRDARHSVTVPRPFQAQFFLLHLLPGCPPVQGTIPATARTEVRHPYRHTRTAGKVRTQAVGSVRANQGSVRCRTHRDRLQDLRLTPEAGDTQGTRGRNQREVPFLLPNEGLDEQADKGLREGARATAGTGILVRRYSRDGRVLRDAGGRAASPHIGRGLPVREGARPKNRG